MAETEAVAQRDGDGRAEVSTIDRDLQAVLVRPPMADPGAWAVTAFATTSFMLGMYNAGLLPSGGVAVVVPVAFFFGGLIQIIVGILEVMRGNVFGAVVFGTYGPFWVIFAAIETWFAAKIPTSAADSALCLFLAMFAVITFYFVIASLRFSHQRPRCIEVRTSAAATMVPMRWGQTVTRASARQ